MAFFVGAVLPYITLIVFIGGMIYQINVWWKLPAPKMTLTPAPKPGLPTWIEMFKEVIFFKSLFKGDKSLWFLGWIFHVMLALIFIGHFRVFLWLPDKMLLSMGMTPEAIDTMSFMTGGVAGVVIIVTLLFLLGRRFVVPRVKQISSTADYFALILLLVILITGDAMRFLSHFDLALTRDYFAGLFTFSSFSVPENHWFLAHFFFAQLLIIYIPFSKILHFGGVFFSEALLYRS
jgi:nitrate reductase gamma subunit